MTLSSTCSQTREAERRHFESVVKSFLYYKEHGHRIVYKHETSYRRLPPAHQQILNYLPAKFEAQKHCLEVLGPSPAASHEALAANATRC